MLITNLQKVEKSTYFSPNRLFSPISTIFFRQNEWNFFKKEKKTRIQKREPSLTGETVDRILKPT